MFSQPYMRGIVPLFGVMAIVALAAYSYYTWNQAKYVYTGPVVISVAGEGEVFAKPDIATFSFGVMAEGDDAASAQNESAEKVNAIMAYLEEQGIEERDIKTQYYNLNPRYEYTQSICDLRGNCSPGERVLRGYQVSQNIQVKVRNTENAGTLISGVGDRGATDISGLNFTVDDESALTAQARAAAIADAQEKAQALAEDLGVRIVRMTGFWEEQGYMPYYGRGGDMMMESAAMMDGGMKVAPSVATGENMVTSRVNISYEVR